ncbi:hypothetical protein PR048_032664 [Dryococelus australis]|uniref:Uncharacterized protein n=1 Tax=Dryococelus australis TaxID=614101 RepID=A0ABQ9G606_9NEOP|nr:hypothetical protein PR048_032664 [Dryococelus australis]
MTYTEIPQSREVVVKRVLRSPSRATQALGRPCISQHLACNVTPLFSGRCRWSTGFLGDLPFPMSFPSGSAPYSAHFTLIGSQDLDVKSRPNLFIHSLTFIFASRMRCYRMCTGFFILQALHLGRSPSEAINSATVDPFPGTMKPKPIVRGHKTRLNPPAFVARGEKKGGEKFALRAGKDFVPRAKPLRTDTSSCVARLSIVLADPILPRKDNYHVRVDVIAEDGFITKSIKSYETRN